MIRLTLITLAALFGAMQIWGSADPNVAPEEITETVIESDEPATPSKPLLAALTEALEVQPTEPVETVEAVDEESAEGIVEVARLETLNLTSVNAPNQLLVVEANDAPPEALLLTNVSPTSTSSETDPNGRTILVVTGNRVNLRAGPSTGNAVVTSLSRGQQTELIAEAGGGWLHIRHIASGRQGYMSGDFLKAVNQ